MISTNKSSVSNLKFEEITKCAIEDWELPTLNHPKLEYVMNSFRVNVARVRHLLLLPTAVAGLTALTRRIHDIAEYEITGSLSRDELSLSPQIRSKINDLATGMLDAKREHAEAQQGTSDWAIFVRNFHLGAGGTLEEYIGTPFGSPGFEETLRTSITGTWTAIETLLGDLWEAALNCHPETLASLKGRSNRIGKPPKQTVQVHQSGREYDAESKHVSLDLIGMHRFDLRNCMGTVFRMQGRVNFTHLSSIREAYSQAFSAKCGSIDSALSGPLLDCIGTVRNLIVHKAGVVDDEYLKRSSYLKIPKANIDKPLSLDGEIVADLIRNAISSANSLSVAVDNWIAQN